VTGTVRFCGSISESSGITSLSYGNRGDDELFGGGSNDTLNGGSDTDSCDGQGGVDIPVSCETQSNIP
jgi:Ca2+-binding RTX toxin-like protein